MQLNLYIFTLILCSIVAADNIKNSTMVFTNEWQDIPEGSSIPAGLHVRINLSTGKKEAKLLEDEQPSQALSILSTEENVHEGIISTQTKEDEKKVVNVSNEDHNFKKVNKKMFKTDADQITKLLKTIDNTSDAQDKLQTLENLEFLVHQIDNALLFIELNGLEKILLPSLVNQTIPYIRTEALRIIGALTQNNPKAQVKVFELNFGSHIAQTLISSTNTEELSAAMFAFGSLLRNYPQAQHSLLSTYGTQALVGLLSKDCEYKIKTKVITLISDIFTEWTNRFNEDMSNDSLALQYNNLDYDKWLNENSFCEAVDNLLSKSLRKLIEEDDLIDYFSLAMESSLPLCSNKWSSSPQLRHTLLTVKNRYAQSANKYHWEIAQQIQNVVNKLFENTGTHYEL